MIRLYDLKYMIYTVCQDKDVLHLTLYINVGYFFCSAPTLYLLMSELTTVVHLNLDL